MKAVKLKIDTTDAMEKIAALNSEAEKLKIAMAAVSEASERTVIAMRKFVEACNNLKVTTDN